MLDESALSVARKVFSTTISHLCRLESLLVPSEAFSNAVDHLAVQRVWTTGMGKAGLVAHKLASSLASNGRPAAYIHAGEALHGDFGAIQSGDVLVACSNSGKTDEVIRVADKAKSIGAVLILITSDDNSEIAGKADVVLCYGKINEACPLGLTPTTSIAIMLAIVDALCMAVQTVTKLTHQQYATNHHAGYLGEAARQHNSKIS